METMAMAGEILQRVVSGESWTKVFPDKRGDVISIVATNTPLYGDEGTLVGDICTSIDAKNFEEPKSLLTIRRDFEGTVYCAQWNGSDVAVKVFSLQEFSDDLISSFRPEVEFLRKDLGNFVSMENSTCELPSVQKLLKMVEELELSDAQSKQEMSKLLSSSSGHQITTVDRHQKQISPQRPGANVGDGGVGRFTDNLYLNILQSMGALLSLKHETYLITKTGKGAVNFMNQRLEIPKDVDPLWIPIIESSWHSDEQRTTMPSFILRISGEAKRPVETVRYSMSSWRAVGGDAPQNELWMQLKYTRDCILRPHGDQPKLVAIACGIGLKLLKGKCKILFLYRRSIWSLTALT